MVRFKSISCFFNSCIVSWSIFFVAPDIALRELRHRWISLFLVIAIRARYGLDHWLSWGSTARALRSIEGRGSSGPFKGTQGMLQITFGDGPKGLRSISNLNLNRMYSTSYYSPAPCRVLLHSLDQGNNRYIPPTCTFSLTPYPRPRYLLILHLPPPRGFPYVSQSIIPMDSYTFMSHSSVLKQRRSLILRHRARIRRDPTNLRQIQ